MIDAVKIARILVRLPYVIKPGPIPPFAVVRSILAKGEFDAGMSGGESWTPIEISLADYDEIIIELKKITKGTYPIQAPDGVDSYVDWVRWGMIQRAGAKGEELSRLFARRDLLERERHGLLELNKGEEAEMIQVELIKVDGETSALLVQIARGDK